MRAVQWTLLIFDQVLKIPEKVIELNDNISLFELKIICLSIIESSGFDAAASFDKLQYQRNELRNWLSKYLIGCSLKWRWYKLTTFSLPELTWWLTWNNFARHHLTHNRLLLICKLPSIGKLPARHLFHIHLELHIWSKSEAINKRAIRKCLIGFWLNRKLHDGMQAKIPAISFSVAFYPIWICFSIFGDISFFVTRVSEFLVYVDIFFWITHSAMEIKQQVHEMHMMHSSTCSTVISDYLTFGKVNWVTFNGVVSSHSSEATSAGDEKSVAAHFIPRQSCPHINEFYLDLSLCHSTDPKQSWNRERQRCKLNRYTIWVKPSKIHEAVLM